MSATGSGALRRTRQACEPCRRKKSKCPGEKPVCSYCRRLNQCCVYVARSSLAQTEQAPSGNLEGRLSGVEDRLDLLIDRLGRERGQSRQRTPASLGDSHSTQLGLPATVPAPDVRSIGNGSSVYDSLSVSGQLYLKYCDSQPLPLFEPTTFVESLRVRDPEIILCVKALCLRFDNNSHASNNFQRQAMDMTRSARVMVMGRLANAKVELSTLQSLCLLSLLSISEGNSTQAGIDTTLVSCLINTLDLHCGQPDNSGPHSDEIRRCLWSVQLLQSLQCPKLSRGWMNNTAATQSARPQYNAPVGDSAPQSPGNPTHNAANDQGIITSVLQLSEVWRSAQEYAMRKIESGAPPPWSPQSDYSAVTSKQMDFESRTPLKYRFHEAGFQEKSIEELQDNRAFWGPWLYLQIIFHAIPCLLNHPFLLSMRLKSFRQTMPQSFLQNSFEQISLHTNWILHFIGLLDRKGFEISDPIFGHCVVIVATIHLQHSFVEDSALRERAQARFTRCQKFLQSMGDRWPHIRNMSTKLEQLMSSVTGYADADSDLQRRQQWSINTRLLWDLLIYEKAGCSSSSLQDVFGPTLLRHSAASGLVAARHTPDLEFSLVGSVGLSGHRTVIPEAVTYAPDEHQSLPYTIANMGSRPPTTQFPGFQNTPASSLAADNLFLQMEDFGRAIGSWWEYGDNNAIYNDGLV